MSTKEETFEEALGKLYIHEDWEAIIDEEETKRLRNIILAHVSSLQQRIAEMEDKLVEQQNAGFWGRACARQSRRIKELEAKCRERETVAAVRLKQLEEVSSKLLNQAKLTDKARAQVAELEAKCRELSGIIENNHWLVREQHKKVQQLEAFKSKVLGSERVTLYKSFGHARSLERPNEPHEALEFLMVPTFEAKEERPNRLKDNPEPYFRNYVPCADVDAVEEKNVEEEITARHMDSIGTFLESRKKDVKL